MHGPLPAKFLHLVFPARGLMHVIANQADQQRRNAAQREHGSPSVMAADENIRDAGKKKSDVVARVHQSRAHGAPLLGPIFGNERSSNRPFAANPDARHESKHRKAPDARGERGQQREQRKTQNAEHHGAHAAEAVGNRSPDERGAVADQKQREENAAVVADVRGGGGNSGAGQQFRQRGNQDEGIDERIHSVHAPAAPGGPEAADLVARELRFGVCRDRSLDRGHASPST